MPPLIPKECSSKHLVFHQVDDAFTHSPFSGNPAMVYRLDACLVDALLQKIAAELNLADTAFLGKEDSDWPIRWFTPRVEVALCGLRPPRPGQCP